MAADIIQPICEYKGVGIVRIRDPRTVLGDRPDLRAEILANCERVQRGVWNPRLSIEENTIDTDLLMLLRDGGEYVGFV